mgnify:FL=1
MSNEKRKELFERAVNTYRGLITYQEDLKQLQDDFTYDKDLNTNGMDKKDVKRIMSAAKLFAEESSDKAEAKVSELKEVLDTMQELCE